MSDSERTIRTNIVIEIIQERIRQIMDEGYSLIRDDALVDGQLAEAGSVYASTRVGDRAENYPSGWVFKPTERRRELIKAAALIMAEIERLDRSRKAEKETQEREKAINEFWEKIAMKYSHSPCVLCPATDGDDCGCWEGTCAASLRKKYESIVKGEEE